jgi:protein Mpv17
MKPKTEEEVPPLECALEQECPVDLFHVVDIIEEQEKPPEENYLDEYFK